MTSEEARTILGVTRGCDADTLRAAFNRLVKTAHPDGGGSDESLRLTVEAYRYLDARITAGIVDDPKLDAASLPPRLEITPSQAMIGGRLVIRLADGRRVAVTLPAGLRQGDKLSVKGLVHDVNIKGRADLFVSGDDLCLTIKANAATLRDGGRVKIKTPSGVRMIWVPRQVGPSHMVRIPGQGLPATTRHPRGAMILRLVPDKPAKPTPSETKRKGFASAWTGSSSS